MFSQSILKYIRYLAYLTAVLIPLVFFPTGIMPFQIIKIAVFQVLAEIIFALWLALTIFNKEYRPKFTPILLALTIFMIVISLSSIFGVDWRTSLFSDESRTFGLLGLFHLFALFMVLSSVKIDWKKLFFLSFGTSVLVSLIGISQLLIVFPKGSNSWLHIMYPGVPERIGSTFSNSAFMAGYLLFNFFIGLWLLAERASSVKRKAAKDFKFWFLGIGAILTAVAIFLSQTIGAILGLVVGILALLVYFAFKGNEQITPKIKLKKLSLMLLIVILIFGGIFWFSKSASFWQKIPGLSRISQASFQSDSIRGRLITWRISLEAFKDKPLLGWGIENFRIAFNEHYDPKILSTSLNGSYWDKPHNVFLEYLATAGILGLLAYLGIFVATFYSLFKKPRISGESHEFAFIAVAISAYLFQNFFIFDTIGTYLMFFLILAYVDSRYGGLSRMPARIGADSERSKKLLPIFASVFLLASLVPIYYNYQIFNASRYEYWGVNYFLNRLPESSLVSFSRAIAVSTPYRDDIRKNFSSTVKQAYQQGVTYPKLAELQASLVKYLELVINRHPLDFFNYISLADFKNVFYGYNPDYLKEAGELSQKALELSPERQQIYYVLAKTKLLEGDVQAAYKIFEAVVNLTPEAGDPHFYFGLMAYGLGDYKKGASEITEAERLGRVPQKYDEALVLGNFVGDYEHDYKKAIELYKQALSLQRSQNLEDKNIQLNILLKLAVAYYFDRNLDQSREAFSELKNSIDLRKLPIYSDLKPVLQELKIDY